MLNHNQYIGQIFGSLEVVGVGPTNKNRKKLLLVKCLKHPDVIPYHIVKQSLINGSSKGCIKCIGDRFRTHGKCRTRVYHVYKRMICRIKDPNDQDYTDYGGRGLDMDPRYDPDFQDQGLEKSFLAFYEDIGDIVAPLTLDRKDNSRGYWKDNLRLVTMTEQAHNRRNNIVNQQIVDDIRNDYNNGMRNKDLCIKYNLSSANVSRITLNKVWK